MLTNRLSLAALMLLVSVPFLQPWHTTPIPSFYSEALAVACGLLAATGLLGARSLPLPGATIIALGLGAIVWWQVLAGLAVLSRLSSLYWLYLLWAALLVSASRFLAGQLGVTKLVRWLAIAILAGASLAALLGIFQPWLRNFGWPGFSVGQGGPLGQANHLNSYLWLGVAAALHLRVTGMLRRSAFWGLIALLVFAAALVGQRSSFLYMLALVGIALWRSSEGASGLDMRRLALGTALLFLAMQPLATLLPPLEGGDAKPPAALRALQQAGGPSIRLQLWRVGLEGITAAPLTGNGVGGYTGLALAHAETIPPEENPGPAESAHNVFIDLAVEFGLPVALLLLLAAGCWLWRTQRTLQGDEGTWTISAFVILGLHALIEYPLSYAYFLGLLAIVTGISGGSWQVGRRLTATALTIGLVAWGGLVLAELRRDYQLLEFALETGNRPTQLSQAKSALLDIPPGSLLSPWVATAACVSLDPLQVSVCDGWAVCGVAMRFAPTVESGVAAAVLQWRGGLTDEAHDSLRRLRFATAYDRGGVERRLDGLILRDEKLVVLRQK